MKGEGNAQVSTAPLVVLGWDAADLDQLIPLVNAGRMPNVSRLLQTGRVCELRSEAPTLSPIVWTTIATGVGPLTHGVLGFTEPTAQGAQRPVTVASREVSAIWNRLAASGYVCHSIGFYASHPAEPTGGVSISNLFYDAVAEQSSVNAAEAVYIDTRYQTLVASSALAQLVTRPEGLSDEVLSELMALPDLPELSVPIGLKEELRRDLAKTLSLHAIACELAETPGWNCLMLLLDGIDTIGHRFGKFHRRNTSAFDSTSDVALAQVIDRTYEIHDRLLGDLLQRCPPETNLLLISDHGLNLGASRPEITDAQRQGWSLAGPEFEERWHQIDGLALVHGRDLVGSAPPLVTIRDIAPAVLNYFNISAPPDRHAEARFQAISANDSEHREAIRHLVALGYLSASEIPQDAEAQRGDDACKIHELVYRLSSTDSPPPTEDFVATALREYGADSRVLKSVLSSPHGRGLQASELDEAIAAWIRREPQCPEPWIARARLYREDEDRLRRAIDEARTAAGSQPAWKQAIGQMHSYANQWGQALAEYRHVIAAMPHCQFTRRLMCIAEIELRNSDTIEADSVALLKQNPYAELSKLCAVAATSITRGHSRGVALAERLRLRPIETRHSELFGPTARMHLNALPRGLKDVNSSASTPKTSVNISIGRTS